MLGSTPSGDLPGSGSRFFRALAAGVLELLTERRTDILATLVVTVALPALIFRSTYDRPLQEISSPALLGGFWVIIALTITLGWLVHRRLESADRRSVSVVQSYHSNMGFLGLPLVAATMGSEATAVASVILGIGAVTHVPVTVFLLVRINGSDASLLSECRKLVTNPVLIALAAGITASVRRYPFRSHSSVRSARRPNWRCQSPCCVRCDARHGPPGVGPAEDRQRRRAEGAVDAGAGVAVYSSLSMDTTARAQRS